MNSSLPSRDHHEESAAQRIARAKRELDWNAKLLRQIVTSMSRLTRETGKRNFVSQTEAEILQEMVQASTRHAMGIFRELGELRRATSEHLENALGPSGGSTSRG